MLQYIMTSGRRATFNHAASTWAVRLFVIIASLVLLAAGKTQAAPGDFLFASPTGGYSFNVPSGVTVDAAGNYYVVDAGNNRIQKFDRSGTFLLQWGSRGSGNGQFSNPSQAATDSAGNVFVTDKGNKRVQKFDGNGVFIAQWTGADSGSVPLGVPYGIAVDASGNVYVVDNTYARIMKFSGSGTFLGTWGGLGAGKGQFNSPYGVAVDTDGKIFVTDTGNHRVQYFDGSGSYLGEWPTATGSNPLNSSPTALAIGGDGNVYVVDSVINIFTNVGTYLLTVGAAGVKAGQFIVAPGIVVDSMGNIVVADSSRSRIQFFSPSGAFVKQWCGACYADGMFNRPTNVAVDWKGNVCVADSSNSRVEIVDGAGNFLKQIDNISYPYGIGFSRNGDMYVVDNDFGVVYRFATDATLKNAWSSGWNNPGSLAVAPNGYVYVVDSQSATVRKFDASGTPLGQFGAYGTGTGQFNQVTGVAVDFSGNIYVADYGNNKVLKFDQNANYLTEWGTPGTGNGQMSHPMGVATDLCGNVYVSEYGNNRIQVFDAHGAFLGTFGTSGSGDGQLLNTGGLGSTPAGNKVYVADTGNSRIQAFVGYGVTRFTVTIPQTITAGAPVTFEVTAFNDAGTVASGYSGTVHFTSGDPRATLPSDTALTNGRGRFTATFWTAGTQSLTVADALTPSVIGSSGALNVTAGTLRPDLTVSSTHLGDFMQGQLGLAYTLTVTNSGSAPTSGPVQITDLVPGALGVGAMIGDGWTCNLTTLSCTRSDSLNAGMSYPPITLRVNVVKNAPATIINTVTVSGGGEENIANDTGTDVTAVTQVNQPFTIWPTETVPTVADSGPDSPVELGVKFRSDWNGTITGIRFYQGAGNIGTHVGSLWDNSGNLLASATFTNESGSGWQQVTFKYPIQIKANVTYVASYHTEVGHYSADLHYFEADLTETPPLHALSDGITSFGSVYAYGPAGTFPNQSWNSTNYWVDVAFMPMTIPSTIWSASVVPAVVDSGPDSAVELGVRFKTDYHAAVTGVRFYKAPGNTGTHVGNLWDSSGHLLATATFTDETAYGWQQVYFMPAIQIYPNQTYVISYHTEVGHYSADEQYFTKGVDAWPLHVPVDGDANFGSVYCYGTGSCFPNQSWNRANYYVDVTMQ